MLHTHTRHTHTLARSISISLSEETATSAKNEIGSAQVARRKGAVQRGRAKGMGMEVWKNGEMGNGVFEVHVVCQENEFHLTAIMWQPFS